MSKAEKLETIYFNWLKQEYEFTDLDSNYISINTPFIDNNYDNIELFASVNGNNVEISDFGYTFFNLKTKGAEITPKAKIRWKIMEQVLKDFGVKLTKSNGTLSVNSTLDMFPSAKNRLLQAVMRINDIEYLSNNNQKKSFNDVVSEYFRENKIFASPSVSITNKDGMPSYFDFSIQNFESERLIKTISRPNDINQAKIFNYDVHAVKPIRDANFYLLINDQSSSFTPSMKTVALSDLDNNRSKVIGYSELLSNNLELVNA